MSNTKTITCVTCPIGCEMKIKYEDGELISVEGNACPRGKKYASDEISNPRRTLTSTVKITGAAHKLMPVKTTLPIKKENLFSAMKTINRVTIEAPVKMGDVIIENFTEDGISLIAGKDVEAIHIATA